MMFQYAVSVKSAGARTDVFKRLDEGYEDSWVKKYDYLKDAEKNARYGCSG